MYTMREIGVFSIVLLYDSLVLGNETDSTNDLSLLI